MEEKEGAPLGGGQARGRQLWGLLQQGFRRAVEKMKNEEMKTTYLSHGLQHQCRIVLASPVRHVTHDSQRRAFVVLDSGNTLHLLAEDGSCRGSVKGPAPMMGVLYASQVDRFVAWDAGGLQVLDSHFQLLSQVRSPLPVRCGIYSEQLNQVVTAGDGNLALWIFRYGFRSLQCHASVSAGLGPQDVFSRLALDAGSSEPSRCFASCATGAAAFDVSRGALLAFKTELHSREITDLAYCEAIGCAITASRDTTIKVWDKEWHIQIVFVGHTAPVTAVTIYPQRPLIFSASQDGTIRTWNLNTVDQVDQVHTSEPVESLKTHTSSHVVSTSGRTLNLWKINQLYSLYTLLGSPAKRLSCPDLRMAGNFPARVLCLCKDSTVWLLEARSGAPLSVLSLEQPSQAREVAYCLPRETLFVLLEQGRMLRANTATSPMTVKRGFFSGLWESQPCCLLLYSHVVDPDKAYATWLEVVQSKGYRKKWQQAAHKAQDRNRFLPILGHRNGSLSVLDWFSGRVQYTVEAHNSEPVTALAEYPAQTCLLSAGADLTVKMWRLFPYVEECLLLLLCVSCASPAWHMCSLGETLAVAFQDPETVTYSIVYYNLMEQTRSEHGPEDDAQDDITGLCCCPNLKLFASASRDGSVKIWDMRNRLLRHLKLNTIPESLAFANHKGDLLVGLEQHLYLIPHSKYLPSYYEMKLLCAKFVEPLKDVSLPISTSNFEALVGENRRRLMQELPVKEAEPPMSGARRMALKESREVREAQVKLEGLSQLAKRNRDLQLLQEGKISPAKKLRFTREMREEAFGRYLQIFYRKRLRLEIPEEDPFDADEVLEALGQMDPVSVLCGPTISQMFLGGCTKPWFHETGSSVFADVSPSLIQASLPAIADVLQVKRKKVDVTTAPSSARMQEPPSVGGAEPPLPHLVQEAPETVRPLSARAARRGHPPALRQPPEEAFEPAPCLGTAEKSKVSAVVSVAPRTSSSPSSSRGFSRSKKSIVFREPVSPHPSQEPQKSPAPTSLLKRSQSSVIIKGFFPERLTSQQGLRSRAELQSQSLLLPRMSSGFIPNSVVVQQFHTPDLLEMEAEKLVRVIGLREESEGSLRASLTSTFAGDELPEEEPLPVVAVESTSKSRMPVESTSTSRMPVESTSKSRIALTSKEEVPSTKQSTSGVFLTQLDESQYPEPAGEVPEVVLPFVDQEWFKKLFPEGFPPGMSLKDFLKRLQESLHTSSFDTKTELVGIITLLQDQLEGTIRKRIQNTLIQVLNKEGNVPSLQEKSQKQFILATLRVLLKLDRDSKELMVELMTYYMMAPAHLRAVIKDMINEMGLYDPHNYFFKEMSSWPVGIGNCKEDVRKFSSQWLEDVIRIFQGHKAHLQEQEALLGKERSLESGRKERKSRKPLGKSRKEARKRAGSAARPAKAAPRERVASPLRQRWTGRKGNCLRSSWRGSTAWKTTRRPKNGPIPGSSPFAPLTPSNILWKCSWRKNWRR
ncbi:WD repeat-containing protein 97 isoform 3-T3 [Liasis olivaceus]